MLCITCFTHINSVFTTILTYHCYLHFTDEETMPKEVKKLAWDHTISKLRSWDLHRKSGPRIWSFNRNSMLPPKVMGLVPTLEDLHSPWAGVGGYQTWACGIVNLQVEDGTMETGNREWWLLERKSGGSLNWTEYGCVYVGGGSAQRDREGSRPREVQE